MAQQQKPIGLPVTISIPPIVFGPEKSSIGYLSYILADSGDQLVVETTEIKISPRRKTTLYKLSDGQAVVITQKKLIRPDGVDGVLQRINGRLNWLSHRVLDEFHKD